MDRRIAARITLGALLIVVPIVLGLIPISTETYDTWKYLFAILFGGSIGTGLGVLVTTWC